MTENDKRTAESTAGESNRASLPDFRAGFSAAAICSACGAEAHRRAANFCLVCGKLLREDYQPLDNFRASYRLQGKAFLIENAKRAETMDLFAQNKNAASETAWACVVYSMVPYLGILFVPLAFIVGGFGFAVAVRKPYLGGRKLSLVSVALGFLVLAMQLVLWWLLYLIPTLRRTV